jgi:hypothetical protein
MAKKSSKKPNMQRPKTAAGPSAKLNMLIQKQGLPIAALAWAGYQQEGRGFVLVIFENDKTDLEFHGVNGDIWPALDLENSIPALKEFVDSYDPTTEVIVSTEVAGTGEILQVGGFELPPPLAYAKLTSNS